MAKNPLLKRANEETEYDNNQVIELSRCSRSAKYFIKNYIKIRHPTKGTCDFKLYDYQEDMIDAYQREKNVIILSARQTGKTECSAAFLLWFAMFHDKMTVLVVSNKNSNAMEMISRITFMYEHVPHWLKPGVDDSQWNKHELAFDNGSRILSQATTENSGRGLSISKLYCLGGDTVIKIKNKITNEVKEISLQDAYDVFNI